MKVLILVIVLLSTQAFAGESKYDKNVRECLKHWKKTPFSSKNLNYKTISTSVSVFGAGKDIIDDEKTKGPKLVFIKPSVNVLGGKLIQLKNPNGWYCLKSNTNVLGKATIELHCKAKLAIASTGATVLGSDKGGQKGTTVLGKTKIKRIGCD